MNNNDRVKLKPVYAQRYGVKPMLGTVHRKSPMGYVTVVWDNGTRAHFAPGSAAIQLDVVPEEAPKEIV